MSPSTKLIVVVADVVLCATAMTGIMAAAAAAPRNRMGSMEKTTRGDVKVFAPGDSGNIHIIKALATTANIPDISARLTRSHHATVSSAKQWVNRE